MAQITAAQAGRSGDADHEWRARQIVDQIARERHLSGRQRDVLARTARGESTKEVAHSLGLSGNTVAYYWAQIFRKLGCHSQVEVMSLLFRRAADPANAVDADPH
jgi:DNA-binding CsgD family transcriptional regulator